MQRLMSRRRCEARSARPARSHPIEIAPYIEATRRAGARTLRELTAALTNRGVPTPVGKGGWRPEQVRRVLANPRR